MASERLSTGIPGLDELLHGGLLPRQTYLLRGGSGTGKTILGLHFLTQGVAAGEPSLLITLGEQEDQIRRNAAALGFDLTGVSILDLTPEPGFFARVETYDIFSPGEVEREPITHKITEWIDRVQPQRIFLDALTQFRYLSPDSFQFHKQTLSFLKFMVDRGATVLYTSEHSQQTPDDDMQFLSDGVIHLENNGGQRSVCVSKFRGSDFRSGRHSLRLGGRGMEVFPRLSPQAHGRTFSLDAIGSGVAELDALLNGGLERGTTTIITGPTGVGKSTAAALFAREAARHGERSVIYLFDEARETLVRRCESIGIPVRSMLDQGMLGVVEVEALQYTPDEFAQLVRSEVEHRTARIVIIDSVAGYRVGLGGENLVTHLHALCRYLQNMGVTVILVHEQPAITGDFAVTEDGFSYLADNLVFLRYLEINGQMRKAIGVLKKRLSDFEKTLREYEINREGVKVGRPLTGLRGILLGVPEWVREPGGEVR
ncbi:MAG TPA: ATPase domain-containing protein [Symbiobacteriaceae bacterium]|nr:ATPase domain-containing protein [Symbiobacteriaceae bacterium]